MKCAYAKAFRRLVNMSPDAIRQWAKDPRAKCASFESTRRRLPALATLKAKPVHAWTPTDCQFAQRVVAFNTRMDGARNTHGCTAKINVSLKNWGRAAPGCPRVPADCKRSKL